MTLKTLKHYIDMMLEDYGSVEQLLGDKPTPGTKPRKFGYKGFDSNLQCRKHQFVIGETSSKPEKPSLEICTKDGFHYCNRLEDVFSHYGRGGNNRFCIVEILGNHIDDNSQNKSITTSMKPIYELTETDIANLLYEEAVHINEVMRIQKLNPYLHVGGSTALFLHGIRLSRIADNGSYKQSDIDACAPFYTPIQGSATDVVETMDDDERSDQADFKEVISFNGIPIDYRIDPKERYEIINYRGFDFKVTLLEIIMEAKFRYAMKGSLKHKEDCYEICGKKVKEKGLTDTCFNDFLATLSF